MSQQPDGIPRRTRRVIRTETPGPAAPDIQQHPQGITGPSQEGRIAPPKVTPSLEVIQAEFEQLVQANQGKFAELAAQGAAPDPFFLVHARVNHLIESISSFAGPNGPRWAALTRLEFERYIAAELEQAGPATRRMQLAEGARYTPGMIAALARQTGTLRQAQ